MFAQSVFPFHNLLMFLRGIPLKEGLRVIQRWASGLIATVIAASSLLLFLPVTQAATGIVAYVPIMLTNNQGSATPTTFQQMITWNPSTYSDYESSTLGNIRFCADSACVTTLNAWLESCTSSCTTSATSATAWVKVTSAIAGGGGKMTIYMYFKAPSVGFDGVFWGEAPGLSGTYGQYDNGANVFGNYWNFAGTSLPSGWSSSAPVTVSNSLSMSSGSAYTNSAVFSSLNNVEEMYVENTAWCSCASSGITQSNSNAPQSGNAGSNALIIWAAFGA